MVQSACQCSSFDPWSGKIPWRKKQQTIPVFLPRKSHGQRSLAGPQSVESQVGYDVVTKPPPAYASYSASPFLCQDSTLNILIFHLLVTKYSSFLSYHSEKHERHLMWKAGAIFFGAYNLCKDFEPGLM